MRSLCMSVGSETPLVVSILKQRKINMRRMKRKEERRPSRLRLYGSCMKGPRIDKEGHKRRTIPAVTSIWLRSMWRIQEV